MKLRPGKFFPNTKIFLPQRNIVWELFGVVFEKFGRGIVNLRIRIALRHWFRFLCYLKLNLAAFLQIPRCQQAQKRCIKFRLCHAHHTLFVFFECCFTT